MIQSGPNPISSPTVPSEQQPGDPAHRQYEQRSPANSPSTKMAEHLENDGWTFRTEDGSLAAHYEHTVVITRREPVLLTAA